MTRVSAGNTHRGENKAGGGWGASVLWEGVLVSRLAVTNYRKCGGLTQIYTLTAPEARSLQSVSLG